MVIKWIHIAFQTLSHPKQQDISVPSGAGLKLFLCHKKFQWIFSFIFPVEQNHRRAEKPEADFILDIVRLSNSGFFNSTHFVFHQKVDRQILT